MKKPLTFYFLSILILLLSLGALLGGGVLTAWPSGRVSGMPLSMLEHSPFPNFLIPGLFLLIFFGILPAVVFYGLIKKAQLSLAEKLNIDKAQHYLSEEDKDFFD